MTNARKLKIESCELGDLFGYSDPPELRVVVRDDGLVRIDVKPDRAKLDSDGLETLNRFAQATGRGLAAVVNDEIREATLYLEERLPHGRLCAHVCEIFNGGRSDVWVAVCALQFASDLQVGTDVHDEDPTMGTRSVFLWETEWEEFGETETDEDELAWFWAMLRANYVHEDTSECGLPSAEAWIAAGNAALAADWQGVRAAYLRLGETPAESTATEAWEAAARKAGLDGR